MAWPRVLLGAAVVAFALAPSLARAAAPERCRHEVAAGDTTSAIAVKYGLSQRGLLELNPALRENPDKLRLGQVLKVCDADADRDDDDDDDDAKSKAKTKDDDDDDDAKSKAAKPKDDEPPARKCGLRGKLVGHEVETGDTLAAIAEQYGSSERDIKARNAAVAAAPDKLRVGQVVRVCVEPQDDKPAGKITKAKECGMETPLFVHEVVPGEHLGQIAGRYGVRKGDLLRLNASLRANPNLLSVGKKIRVCPEIPPRERHRSTHTVASGENLGGIAEKYGLSPKELERFQQGKLEDPNHLRDGQRLVVWVDGAIVRGFGGRDVDTGRLPDGMQLPPSKHYVIKWEAGAWGTRKTIAAIQGAVADYKRRSSGGPKIHIGDISKRGGGKFPPHLSHQFGRDVDIGYVLTGPDANETKFRHATSRNLDVARTWNLIKAFIDTDDVTYIFMDYRIQKLLYEYALDKGVDEDTLDELFQYPRGRGRSHGIIRHWRGHANHFHVRFRP